MTSRDFGFTTLRSAVAYRRNNTLVPPNNVYVTSTNGAATFSDTLTISTINVSTATISTLTVSTINGGGGGGVILITAGTNISTTGTASNPTINVNINSTLEMNGENIHSSGALGIASDAILNLDGTFVNMVASIGDIYIQTNSTASKVTVDCQGGDGTFTVFAPNVKLFGLSTLQTNKMVYIADGTGFLSVGDLPSSVNSVTAGTNISITGTASTPIINVDINSTLLMNGFPIYDYSTITIASGSTINLSTLSTSIVLDQASTNITITSITGPINLTGNPVVIKNVTPVLQFDDTTTSTNITVYNNGSAFGDTALITNAGELGVYNETGGQSMRIGTSTIGGFPVSYITGLSTTTLFIGENGASSFSNITLGSTSISLKLDKRLDTNLDDTAAQIELFGTGEIDVISYYGSINVTADTGGINLTSPIITMSTLNTAFTNKILYYNTTDGAVTYDDAPPGTTGVVSVSSGINISTTGTAINPIINVNINSTLDMNFNNIINVSTINLKSADSAQIQFYNSTNVLAGALTYNQAAEFLTLECSTVLNIKTTQVGVGNGIIIDSNSSAITLQTNGGQINICSHYLPGEPSTNRINILADGDGGEIDINAPELITITTQSSLNMRAVSVTGDAVMKMTGDFINLSTLNNLNMYVGSTINMTGGTTLISSTYLLLTINNTPYKIALL